LSGGFLAGFHKRDPGTNIWVSVLISNLFSGLVEHSPNWNILPDVASSWRVLEKGTLYVFQLRDDVFWSDGNPVTAGDFEFAWKRILNPSTKSPVAALFHDIDGAEAYQQNRVTDPDLVGIWATDDHTLKVKLKEPAGYFLQILTMTQLFPVPRHVVEAFGDTWTLTENLVSNGAFILEKELSESSLLLRRNPTYHGHFRGNVEKLILLYDLNKEEIYSLYKKDEIEVCSLSDIPSDEIENARHHFVEDYLSMPVFTTTYLHLKTQLPPFDQVGVRRAFAHAINREAYVAAIGGGAFPATGGMIPGGLPGYSPGIGLTADPALARQLLDEAGYPQGRGLPELTLLTLASRAESAKALAEQWRSTLGVKIHVNIYEIGKPRPENRTAQFGLWSWNADYLDPDNILRVCPAASSWKWINPQFIDLIERARRLADQPERLRLYRQADRILVEDAAIIPMEYGRDELLIKPWVRNKVYRPPKVIIIDPH
jgi:oligopeptide transport system substrate-binding protein